VVEDSEGQQGCLSAFDDRGGSSRANNPPAHGLGLGLGLRLLVKNRSLQLVPALLVLLRRRLAKESHVEAQVRQDLAAAIGENGRKKRARRAAKSGGNRRKTAKKKRAMRKR
jgi:hypothetical protein